MPPLLNVDGLILTRAMAPKHWRKRTNLLIGFSQASLKSLFYVELKEAVGGTG